MQHQNKAGNSLPQSTAPYYPAPLVSAIAHLRAARRRIDAQRLDLPHVPKEDRENLQDWLQDLMDSCTEVESNCADFLFDILVHDLDESSLIL